jgi:phospholipid/cholesterol/gamma-HCH transport system permease protein
MTAPAPRETSEEPVPEQPGTGRRRRARPKPPPLVLPPLLRTDSVLMAPLREVGKFFQLGATTVRAIFKRPFQVRELIEQFWFIASVTILPAALVSIPFGAVIVLQVGSLTQQIGAQSFTGGASVLAVIQQASPVIVCLLISGAGGSAICADLGSRTIREELQAMEVMGVSPIQRLVVPRVLAAMAVAVLLNGMVSVVGTLGGYFFNVYLQHGTPGAYLSSFSALAQLPDLYVGEFKALIFGFLAGLVAAYRGLNPRGGPKGVGDAVNQSVVITFLLLFFVNAVVTGVYLQVVPQKGS